MSREVLFLCLIAIKEGIWPSSYTIKVEIVSSWFFDPFKKSVPFLLLPFLFLVMHGCYCCSFNIDNRENLNDLQCKSSRFWKVVATERNPCSTVKKNKDNVILRPFTKLRRFKPSKQSNDRSETVRSSPCKLKGPCVWLCIFLQYNTTWTCVLVLKWLRFQSICNAFLFKRFHRLKRKFPQVGRKRKYLDNTIKHTLTEVEERWRSMMYLFPFVISPNGEVMKEELPSQIRVPLTAGL